MKQSMVVYRSFYEAISELPEIDQAKAWKAVFEYGLNQSEIETTGVTKALLMLMKPQMDANNVRYENGKRGGRPVNENQTITKAKPKNNQLTTKDEASEKPVKTKNDANEKYSELLNDLELELPENARKNTKNERLKKLDTLRKLIEIDNYTPEHIKKMVLWARNDDFWRSNFLSINKLRQKDKNGTTYAVRFTEAMGKSVAKYTGSAIYEHLIKDENLINALKSNSLTEGQIDVYLKDFCKREKVSPEKPIKEWADYAYKSILKHMKNTGLETQKIVAEYGNRVFTR
jgi:hypothetical protein